MPKVLDAFGARLGSSPVRRIYKGSTMVAPGVCNLMTNPSFEAATPAVSNIVRTNLVTNPSFELTASPYFVGFGSATIQRLADTIMGGFSLQQIVTAAGNSFVYHGPATGGTAITPGTVYTASAFVKAVTGLPPLQMGLAWRDSSGTLVGGVVYGTSVTPQGLGNIVRPYVTATAPTGAVTVQVIMGSATAASGDEYHWDGVMLEASSVLGRYIDGSLTSNVFTYAWSGAAHASASTVTMPQVLRTNLASDPAATTNVIPIGNAGWGFRWYGSGGNGTSSKVTNANDGPLGIRTYLRKTWTVGAGPGDTGFSHAGGDNSAGVSLSGIPIVPGMSYTVSAYLRANSTAVGLRTANVTMYWRDAAGNFINGPAGAQINLPNNTWTRIYTTAVAPANAAYLSPNTDPDIGPNWVPGDTLDGTALLIEAGSTLGTYFDGTFGTVNGITNGWVAAANNSQSVTAATMNIVRTNLSIDPAGTQAVNANGTATFTNRWFGGAGFAGTFTPVLNAYDAPLGTGLMSYLRKSWTQVTGGGTNDISVSLTTGAAANGVPVSAAQTYTISFYWRTSWGFSGSLGSTLRNHVEIAFFDVNGTQVGATVAAADVNPAATGVWQRLSVTATAPAGALYATATHVYYNATGPVVGSYIDVTGLLFEQSPVLGTYFDGTTPSMDADLVNAWSGPPNHSVSNQSGIAPAGVGVISNHGATVMSTAWANTDGTKSARIIATGTTTDTFFSINGLSSFVGVGGQVVTATMLLRLPAALTGSTDGKKFAFRFQVRLADNSTPELVFTYTAIATNAPGVYAVTATAPIPATFAAWTFARVEGGASTGGGDIWIDDLFINIGPVATPGNYRDGRSVGWSWDGAVDGSVSRGLM